MRGELNDLTLELAKRPTLNGIEAMSSGPPVIDIRSSNPFSATKDENAEKNQQVIEELSSKVALLESTIETMKIAQMI